MFIINNMLNDLKLNGEIILEGLKKKKELCISDIVRDFGVIRCQARAAVAYLLGRRKIKERNIGMAKVYTLK